MARARMTIGELAKRKRGAVEQRNLEEHVRLQERIEWDLHSTVSLEGRLPPEWTEIWQGRSTRQSRVTMRVDDDVLRFFRAMGEGYGPRMNAVLRSFMTARLSGMIEEEDLLERYREEWMGKPRPSEASENARILGEVAGLKSAFVEFDAIMKRRTKTPDRPMDPDDLERLRMLAAKLEWAGGRGGDVTDA